MSVAMTSRSSHHTQHVSPKSSDMVDFKSLVWPPPELRLAPSPKPYIVHSANNATYTVYPGQTMAQARRAAGIQTPDSDSEDDELQQPTNRPPLIDNRPPLRPRTAQVPNYTKLANGPVDSKSKGQFGCKDYPAGYVPTPRPLSPPVHRTTGTLHTPRPSASVTPAQLSSAVPPPRSVSSAAYSTQSATRRSIPPTSANSQTPVRASYTARGVPSRVEQTIRSASTTRIPNSTRNQANLVSPSSRNRYPQRPADYFHSQDFTFPPSDSSSSDTTTDASFSDMRHLVAPPTSSRSHRTMRIGTESSSNDTSPLIILPEGLHYSSPYRPSPNSRAQLSSAIPSDVLPSPSNYPHKQTNTTTSRQRTPRSQPNIPFSIKPTRNGYWNRRGDSLTADGRVVPARSSQAYPEDLADYPQYAFMNESGVALLPEVEEDRIAAWRIGTTPTR